MKKGIKIFLDKNLICSELKKYHLTKYNYHSALISK